MATNEPEELTPTEPAISGEAPKKRPWLKIVAVLVVVVVVIAAVAFFMWPRNHAPTISQAAVSSKSADVNTALTFTAQASDQDGNPLAYAWDFGDNSTGTGAQVTHAYALPGRFIALLTVSDGQGGTVTNDNSLIFVEVSHAITQPTTDNTTGPATAMLSADRSVVAAGDTVHFNSNSSWAYVWSEADAAYSAVYPTGRTIGVFASVQYTWYDGSAATSGNISTVGQTSHLFKVSGNFMNKLTVTTAAGPTGTATATYAYTVRVQPATPVIAVKNPDIFTSVEFGGGPQHLDPAVDYETSGGEILQNVYETLVWYQEGSNSTTLFVPRLATNVPTVANGGISADGLNYTFNLRQNVKFHDGTTMTADDVVYSLQRVQWIHNPDGPSWMMDAPMTNYIYGYVGSSTIGDWVNDSFAARSAVPARIRNVAGMPAESAWDTTTMTVPLAMAIMNSTVEKVNASTVVIHLLYAYPAFTSILAYTVASIVPKAAVLAHGGDSWETSNLWFDFNTDGTGPFQMKTWEQNQVIILTRWDGYWRTPAKLAQINIVQYNDVASREFLLFAGDADWASIPRNYMYDVLNADGTTKYDFLNITKGLPTYNVDFIGFNQNISVANVPPGYPNYAPTNTFYSDVHIRRAFSSAFDYQTYIDTVYYGTAIQARGPIPDGMMGYNSSIPLWPFDLAQTEAELKLAMVPGTSTSYWAQGFEVTLFYNAGNTVRQEGLALLKQGLEKLNDPSYGTHGLIKVNVQALDWAVYLTANQHRGLPVFFIGWAPDYADPDDYVGPYLSGLFGTFAMRQSYNNPVINTMIAQAARELDPAKRQKLYEDMVSIAYLQDVPNIWAAQATNFWVQRTWVQGWWYNPMVSPNGFYYYNVWKA